MSVYVSFDPSHPNSMDGKIQSLLSDVLGKAGTDFRSVVEEAGSVSLCHHTRYGSVAHLRALLCNDFKTVFKLAASFSEEDKAALEELSVNVSDTEPAGYHGIRLDP